MEEQLKKPSEGAVPMRDSAVMDGQGVHVNQEEKKGTTPPPPPTQPQLQTQPQPHQTLLQPQQPQPPLQMHQQQPQLLQPKPLSVQPPQQQEKQPQQPPPQPQVSQFKPPQPPEHPQITPKLLELQAKKQKKTLAGENQERINYLVQASRALVVMAAKTQDKEKHEKRNALNQSVTGQERKKGKYVQEPSDVGGNKNCKGRVDCASPLSKQKEVQKPYDGSGYKRKFNIESSDDDESSSDSDSSSTDSSDSSSSSDINTKKQEQEMGWEMRGQIILDDTTLISINKERKLQNKSESKENQSNFEVKALGSSAEEKEKLVKSEENKSLDNINADTSINDRDEKEMQNTEDLEMSWEVSKDKEKVLNYEIKSNDKKDKEIQNQENLETIRENIEKMEGVSDELTVESKREEGNQAVCDMHSSDIESKVEIQTIVCGIENSAIEEVRAEDEAVQTSIEMMLQELKSIKESASNVSSKKELPSKISSQNESPYKSSTPKIVPHKTSSQKELPTKESKHSLSKKEAKHSLSKKESPKKKLSAKSTKNQSLQAKRTGLLALASQTGALASGVGRRCVLRLNPGLKRVICKGCGAALVYGVNARVRHRSRRQKHLVITCLLCHTIKRFNSDPKHKLWFDQQEAFV